MTYLFKHAPHEIQVLREVYRQGGRDREDACMNIHVYALCIFTEGKTGERRKRQIYIIIRLREHAYMYNVANVVNINIFSISICAWRRQKFSDQ